MVESSGIIHQYTEALAKNSIHYISTNWWLNNQQHDCEQMMQTGFMVQNFCIGDFF